MHNIPDSGDLTQENVPFLDLYFFWSLMMDI